jgi:thioredoxin-related protein
MAVRTLLIVLTLFVVGAGGKFAYDTYQHDEQQKLLEGSVEFDTCSFCDAVKKEKTRMREVIKKERDLLEELAE